MSQRAFAAFVCALAAGCAQLPEPAPANKLHGPGPLVPGNAARLLVDGPENYRETFAAIGAARDHVNIETYILEGDGVGEKLLALLVEKEAQGVQVNLLYDAVGSRDTPDVFMERMRA